MWQRIQTVFLVIAMLSLIAMIFLPIWVLENGDGQQHQLYALHYSVVQNGMRSTEYFPYTLTGMIAVAALTIAFIEVGKYKNRMLQMKLGALNSLFMAGTMACAVIFSNQMINAYPGGQYGAGLWMPAVAVVCNLLANRFIRRDEKIVRDADRLR